MTDILIPTLLAAAQPQGEGGGGMMGMLLPMVIIFVIFYFLLIRPQQKKAQEHQKFLDGLEKGTDVITNGGIIGKITGITDKIISLEVAPKIRIKVTKSAIAGLAPKGSSEEDKT